MSAEEKTLFLGDDEDRRFNEDEGPVLRKAERNWVLIFSLACNLLLLITCVVLSIAPYQAFRAGAEKSSISDRKGSELPEPYCELRLEIIL